MKKSKIVIFSLLCAILGLSITGCGRADGSVASKDEVINYVKKNVSEDCSLVKEKVLSESPRKVVYTFKSDARGFEFEVVAQRWPHGWFDAVFYYEPIIVNHYSIGLHHYYDERMYEVFGDLLEPKNMYLYISSTKDIEKLSTAIVKANEIYAEEKEYNTDAFLKENPYCRGYVRANTENSFVNIATIPIDGTTYTEAQIKDILFKGVSQHVKDGELSGSAFPGVESYTQSLHVTTLENMYINGEKIESYSSEDEKKPLNYCYAKYDQNKQKYMMSIDLGFVVSRGCKKPYCIPSVVAAVGGEYSIPSYRSDEYPTYLKGEWTISGHKWKASIYYDRPNQVLTYSDLKVTRDGEELNIDYRYNDDHNGYSFTQITIDDFCSLFDLTYEINENESAVYFTSIQ